MRYVGFDARGAIVQVIDTPYAFLPIEAGDIDDVTHYVDVNLDPPRVCPRQEWDLIHTQTALSLVLAGLPHGTQVEVEGFSVLADQDTVEIEFDSPGTYSVVLSAPPQYLDKTLEVTVG